MISLVNCIFDLHTDYFNNAIFSLVLYNISRAVLKENINWNIQLNCHLHRSKIMIDGF